MRLFISHTHKDNSFVEKLVTDIDTAGIDCWLDLWEMKVGDSLRKRIEEGISSSDWLAVILSQHSVQSAWVEHELSMGFIRELDSRHVFVLPVVLDSSEIPLSLRDKFFADFRYDYDFGYHALLQKLLNLNPKELAQRRRLKHYCKRCDEQIPFLCTYMEQMLSIGLSLAQSLDEIAPILPKPLSDELVEAIRHVGGNNPMAVMERLLERVPTYRMQLVTKTLALQRNFGLSAADCFRNELINRVEAGQLLIPEQPRTKPSS